MAFLVGSLVLIALVTLLYLGSFWVSATNRTIEKLSAYECGLEPIGGDARMKFEILYYVIGILYLIFDLEIIFLFPAGVALLSLNLVFATTLHTLPYIAIPSVTHYYIDGLLSRFP